MTTEQNDHIAARNGIELRNFGYTKAATFAALPATGRAGEIYTVTTDGHDYVWNNVLSRWLRISNRFGSLATTGTLDFNDATNATHGSGATLLQGTTAANAPIPGSAAFWHTFCFEFNTHIGTGNLTQLAIPYSNSTVNGGTWVRGRHSGVWTAWRRLDAPQIAATVGALPATGQAGEIYNVTADGRDYHWNPLTASWVPWYVDGTVLRQSITGSASVAVTGRAAAELTLTGNVTALTITGWDTSTTRLQRVRVQVVQDATGGRTFAWGGTSGIWVESPPNTLDTDANATSLQFFASTTDGGTTVWLEPIGVTYANDCRYMQVAEAVIPEVVAGGVVTLSHSYETVYGVELVEIATGRRVLADWYQTPNQPGSPINVDFSAAHASGTYTARVSGVALTPCELSVSTSAWEQVILSLGTTSSVTTTVTYVGAAGAVQWLYGDGTTATVTSGSPATHAYGTPYAGNVVLRWRRGTAITEFSDTVSPWTFDLSVLPATVTKLTVTGASSAIRGSVAALPPAMTDLILTGANTTFGSVASLPSTLTRYNNQGQNTTTGSVASLPSGLITYQNLGLNTTSGSVASLPATLVTYNNQGLNTTTGSVAALPAGLVTFNNQGSNTTSGSVASLPAGLVTYINLGLNTTSGSVASLPATLVTYDNEGLNTTTGSVTTLPAGLVLFKNLGTNTTSGSIATLPATLTRYQNEGANTTTGSIASLPSGLQVYSNIGQNTVSGSVATLPSTLTFFVSEGQNTTSGSIASLPAGLTFYSNTGLNTTSGSVNSLPATLATFRNEGQNTTSGSISSLPAALTYYVNKGQNTATLTAGYTPPAALTRFIHRPASGSGLTSTMVDTILAAINGLGTSNGGSETPDVDLAGFNSAPSATGVSHRTQLANRGWTVATA